MFDKFEIINFEELKRVEEVNNKTNYINIIYKISKELFNNIKNNIFSIIENIDFYYFDN